MSDDGNKPPNKRLRLNDNSPDNMENELIGTAMSSSSPDRVFNASQDMFPDSSPSYLPPAASDVAIQIEDDERDGEMCARWRDDGFPVTPTAMELGEVASRDQHDSATWHAGVSLEALRDGCADTELPPVAHADNHAVLFQLPVVAGEFPLPFPESGADAWDGNHVRMPCSPHSLYLVTHAEGHTELSSRWEMIAAALSQPIHDCRQLRDAILSYNNKYARQWHFNALLHLFDNELEDEETHHFFSRILPGIIRLALDLPRLITRPVPLLRQHCPRSLSLSQQQIASLLANAFLCTFPRRSSTQRRAEYANFPDINFNRLFDSGGGREGRPLSRDLEKLKCVFNYLRRVCGGRAPRGVLTFTRRHIPAAGMPRWDRCDRTMPALHITSAGTIEEQGAGMLQVDFANCLVGGGVLGSGCVQEEIRFVICPELIVARLFTEKLDATEALLITGCEQFNRYSGYADSFRWEGDWRDSTPRDPSGRRQCSLVAIDALHMRSPAAQFAAKAMLREVNKAYAGFCNPDAPARVKLAPVATGNWGCGAFRGDAPLKALLQMMGAAEAERGVAYFTFGDEGLGQEVADMHACLTERRVTVARLWGHLSQYHDRCHKNGAFKTELYPYLYDAVVNSNNNSVSAKPARQSSLRQWLTSSPRAGPSPSNLSAQRSTDLSRLDRGSSSSSHQLSPEEVERALLELPPPFDEAALEEKLSRIESGISTAPVPAPAPTASTSVPKRGSFFRELGAMEEASGRDAKSSGRNSKSSWRDEKSSGRNEKYSGRDEKSSERDEKSSGRDDKSSGRDDKSSGRDDKSTGRDARSSGRGAKSDQVEQHSPAKFLKAFERRESERRNSGDRVPGENVVIQESPESSRDGSQYDAAEEEGSKVRARPRETSLPQDSSQEEGEASGKR